MVKKELQNGKVASVGEHMTIVYNTAVAFREAKQAVHNLMNRCCKDKAIWHRLVDGKKVCGYCLQEAK